jgi:hypothetical protein
MISSIVRSALVGAALLVGSGARAADPIPEEAIPIPRTYGPVIGVAPGELPPAWAYYRVSRYEVWQNLGVDRQGRFRPVVVYSPDGPYYRYNHAPFPWATNHQREFMPYIVDSPPPSVPQP